MKKTVCFIFPLVLLFMFSKSLIAQDTIFKKNKEQIICKVEEIGINEIKYKDFKNLNGPVIVIRKVEVLKIVFENGTETYIFEDPYSVNQEEKVHNKSSAIKFEFFSPLRQNLGFAYERMIKVGLNLETKIGIIGPGFNTENSEHPSGVYLKIGPKFLIGSSVVMDGMRYAHQLHGFYIKPELIFNTFSITSDYQSYNYYTGATTSTTTKESFTNYGVDIVFGKQYILGNIMTFDWYFGIGYGGQSSSTNSTNGGETHISACYSHTYLGSESPMIMSGGMTLGVLF